MPKNRFNVCGMYKQFEVNNELINKVFVLIKQENKLIPNIFKATPH